MGPEDAIEHKICDSDLPALFAAADSASRLAKRNYHIWTGIDLLLLIAGTLVMSIETTGESRTDLAVYIAAICFIVSWFSTLVILKARYDKIWYGARAVAETVKTLSWKYMTCTDPFSLKINAVDADEALIAKLLKILSEREELFWLSDGSLGTKSEITENMRKTRTLDLESRKKIYWEQRINDQRIWYSKGARENRKAAHRWLYGVLLAQLLAIVFTLLLLHGPDIIKLFGNLNWVHVFSASAIACLAWMQLKQNHELAQAYAVAAHELGLISEQISYIKTEEDFCKFVTESENSISREHTMWMAKRDRFS